MKNIILSILALGLMGFGVSAFAAGDYNLENVTGDGVVRWIVTPASSVWHASVSYAEWDFTLHAKFKGISDPQGDDFYEGWLVQKSPFKFISTGELKKVDGNYINHFESDIDYRSYDFYVLTLEPNDGNPAPADHIFEGTVVVKDAMMKKETMEKKSREVSFDVVGKGLSFDQKEIKVYKWDTVTINFKNEGWFHDWVIDEFDAATAQISTGETSSVTFVADEAWTFEYYCSVGNHRAAGMVGNLVVQEHKMMDKGETMVDKHDTMMKKEDPKRKLLKASVVKRLSSISLSTKKIDIVLERIENLEERLPTLRISDAKKVQYVEILSVLTEVLLEKKTTMMQK